MLYHVSPVPGLRVLRPRVSSHGKAYVYAVEQLTVGLLFGAPKDDLDFMMDCDSSGRPVIYECYPHAFERKYGGKRCSVYELREDGFQRGITGWSPELVCETAVPVQRERVIPDLSETLLQEREEGRLILHRYQDTPEYKRFISEHVVDRLIRFDLLSRAGTDPRLQTHYYRIAQALRSIMDGHLLGETKEEERP